MITSLILLIFYGFIALVTSPLRLFSDVTLDPNVAVAVTQAKSSLAILTPVIPVGTILAILTIVIATELILVTYKGIMWVIKKIPGIS